MAGRSARSVCSRSTARPISSRAENSGVIPDKPATPILDFTQNGVAQGYVEGANVNPIEEMTKLISLTRNFDGVNSEVAQTESSMEDAIKSLAT